MRASKTLLRQSDATKLYKAALYAGFVRAKVVYHPDGRLECEAALDGGQKPENPENSWDDVLK